MRLSLLILIVAAGIFATGASSDEPARPQQPLKQRVAPKLLREAMLLQDSQSKPAETTAVLYLDELQRLSDRIRKNGDPEGADLIVRFIHDHQRLAKQVAVPRKLAEDGVCIHIEAFEVHSQGLAHNKILSEANIAHHENSAEVRNELNRLVANSHAKVLIQPVSLLTTLNQPGRYASGGEFPIPKSEDGKTVVEYREFGVTIAALPTLLTKDQIRLQLTCDIVDRDEKNTITVLGTRIPILNKRKIESTVYSNLKEVSVHSYAQGNEGARLFVLTKVEPHS